MTIFRKIVTSVVVAFAAFSSITGAHPIVKRQAAPALTDLDILQFALTLEHLESAFYKEGFAKFPAADFLALGLTQEDVDGLTQIGVTEATHVTALMAAIAGAGATPVQPCTYNFGLTDAASMVAAAKVLEAVGISAYLGAAPLITDGKILSAAASIVTVESRHQTFIRTALKQSPVPQAFDAAVSARQIFTLAAGFITECPAGSSLGLQAFPSLNIVNAATVTAGSVLTLSDPTAFADGSTFCAFTSGEAGTQFAPLASGSCVVPQGLGGEVYVVLTSSGTTVTDEVVLAGLSPYPIP
ncbi:hypothetical protein P167DRAFT_556663 [Morchella conica CCBAS932]|uniref:Twin-arginine translocation pathway signal n=1 Tax=Morchella conica CCBAS932 TaxID=1392247 RepID=A0A3N4L2N0_9PEZI|nr:hypothetical protein P167DRAFT_556663 [Morchella conica CCBAS932]